MKRLSVGLSLLFIVLFAQATFAVETVTISILDLHPTQPAAGVASTDYFRKTKYAKINDLDEYRALIVSENPLRAVRGPGGEIYLTDGHHRALGIFRTSAEKCASAKSSEGVEACMKRAKIRVKIEGDFSKRSWNDFVDTLLKDNNMYLPPEVREKVSRGEITREQIFKNPGGVLPPIIGKLANDPMRSALGALFSRQKFSIDGNNFVNYLEFLLAEKIADKVKVEAGSEFTSEVQISLAGAIFYNPDVLKYLRCLARTDDIQWEKAQTDINLALRIEANIPFERTACEAKK